MSLKRRIKFLSGLLDFNYSSYAASVSFFALLSLFPFCILLLNFVFLIYKTDNLNWVISFLSKYFTSYGIELIQNEIKISFENYKANIGILSFIAFTWSSMNLYSSVEKGLNACYEIKAGRGFLHSKLLSLIIVIVLIPSLLIIAQLNIFYRRILMHIGIGNSLFAVFLRMAVIFASLLALHILSYIFFPYKKIRLISTIPGTLFSTISWMILSISFDLYIKNYSAYSKVYGSIATIIIFLIYIYFISTIFLMGARLNFLCSREK